MGFFNKAQTNTLTPSQIVIIHGDSVTQRRKSQMYLCDESHVVLHKTSNTTFTVNQLKTKNGKKLVLEANSQDERDEWVRHVEAALELLKRKHW